MATFYPSLEKIQMFTVPPTEGEMTLLRFLERTLDDSYEVYFNPYLNGDRPDVLIMREGNGVLVIEVKDWNLQNFSIDERKKWIYTPNHSVVKSPIDQVQKYKTNLYDLHVDNLLARRIQDKRHFSVVSCAVYFHCASQYEVNQLVIAPFSRDRKYQNFIRHFDLIGCDSLEEEKFTKILETHYLLPYQHSVYFKTDLYNNFKRILQPTEHMRSQGEKYVYSDKQKEIIYSTKLEQRVKGVFGSGKTTVLAARAVQAYKRALEWKSNPRILILTFNITLKNFIHDKLMRVDEAFPMEAFIVINYHSFINAELNNLNIEFEIPKGLSEKELGEYLERNYYSNKSLFESHKNHIVKYDAVLIDEIQDFHRPWMDIIKTYFRNPNGDYVLFGDVKQNIYGQPTEKRDVITNVRGVNELKYCFRSDFKVRDLALSYQKNIFGTKYDVDDFSENDAYGSLGLVTEKAGYLNYMYLSDVDPIGTLYNIIRENILNKTNNVAPNDITILGHSARTLRLFDCYYRHCSREKTNSMLESIETMYMTHLNELNKQSFDEVGWFQNISKHLEQTLFQKRPIIYDNDFVKLRKTIAQLFTIHDLYSRYPDVFESRVDEACKKSGISIEAFLAFQEHYKEDLTAFREDVYRGDYKFIRDNKKLHFWMNSGSIKVSTINSFKGWESEVVFLLLEQKSSFVTDNDTFDELLYTGITRSKRNLIVINVGNKEYDEKIRPLIKGMS